jgi:hypothetical protein
VLPQLAIEVRLPTMYGSARAVSPDGRLGAQLESEGGFHRLTLSNLSLYGIVVLEG